MKYLFIARTRLMGALMYDRDIVVYFLANPRVARGAQ